MKLFAGALLCFAGVTAGAGVPATAIPSPRDAAAPPCNIVRAEQSPEFQTKPKAAIYGKTLNVPRIRVRAYDTVTERALDIQRLRVLYAWDWLDYPYPGTQLGNWSAAWDMADCTGARAGSLVVVPAFELQPRGWYGGHFARYPFARPPHVTRIVFEVLVTDTCQRKVELSPGQAESLTRDIAVITTSCSPQAGAGERAARVHLERAR